MRISKTAAIFAAALVFAPLGANADVVCDITYNDNTLFVTMRSDSADGKAYFFINSVDDDGKKTTLRIDEVSFADGEFVYIEQMSASKAASAYVCAADRLSLKPISAHTNIAEAANARKLYSGESAAVKEMNKEIVGSLKKANESLEDILDNFSRSDRENIINHVMDVFDWAVRDSGEFIINKENIKARYAEQIDAVRNAYDKKTDDQKKDFKTAISRVDPESFGFIKDFFDIDIDNY